MQPIKKKKIAISITFTTISLIIIKMTKCHYIFNVFVSLLFVTFQLANSESTPFVVEVWDVPLTNISDEFPISNGSAIKDIPENCSKALQLFSGKVTDLTGCTILNARPVRICTKCEAELHATDEAYNKLLQGPDECHKFFFESDQIGIIDLVYRQGKEMWSNCFCQNCYNHRNDTQEFLKTAKDLDDCMKHFNRTSKGLNNTCNTCQEFFIKMNAIYRSFIQKISDNEADRICIDIVDQMNITRHLWSSQNCLKFDSNIGYPNIVTSVLVGCIPIFFYLLVKNISIIEDVKLVRPKRKSYASITESLQTE